jgi:ribosome-binding factor A
MHPYKRSERLGELILAEISDLIRREIKDPRIGFVTFTRVEMSEDLRHAKVFVSSIGAEPEKARALQGLSSAAC